MAEIPQPDETGGPINPADGLQTGDQSPVAEGSVVVDPHTELAEAEAALSEQQAIVNSVSAHASHEATGAIADRYHELQARVRAARQAVEAEGGGLDPTTGTQLSADTTIEAQHPPQDSLQE